MCLNFVRAGALWATILFAFGTSMWSVASQSLCVHGPATFFLCLALYLILIKRGYDSFKLSCYIGSSVGLSVLCKPTNGLFIVSTVLMFLVLKKWLNVLGFILCAMVSVVVFLLYNTYYFSETVYGGYGHLDNFWSTPFLIGLAGLLFAPSRGLLCYSPAFIVVPLGIKKVFSLDHSRKNLKIVILFWFVGVLGLLGVYAKWYCWWGAWCYGPRFLCETLPLFSLFFAYAYASMKNKFLRKTVVSLIVISIIVHFLGVFGTGNNWNKRYSVGAHGKKLFNIRDTQIQAHAKHLFSPLMKD